MPEVIGAFAGWEGCEGSGDGADCIASSRGRLSRERFELSEDLPDRIEGCDYWARKTRERRRLGIPFKSRARPERFCNTLCQLSAHLRTRERSLLHVETGQADWVLTLGLAMTPLVRPKCNIL